MCGIAGAYLQAGAERLTAVMCERQSHRGPDAAGLTGVRIGAAEAALGQRRLSIIDLSTDADQPFTKDGFVLVYNGELYNYRALRERLIGLGARFRTASDTEVLLEAWRHWGPDCLRMFRGMFAFALLEPSGRLVLARDHLGIKPMHLMPRGHGLLFASELKAIVAVTGAELSVDVDAVTASALYYWVPDDMCSYREVRRLRPGSWLEWWPDGRSAEHSFWRPADAAADAARRPAPDLREVIEDSVTAHLVADVPISTFLSGGLDSSIITALAARAQPDLDAYTIAFRPQDNQLEAMPDDARYARLLAEELGIRLHEIVIAPDIVDLLPRIVGMLDEPIGDAAAINTYLMCRAARDAGVKVLLSGMGADELFGGYRKHAACLMADHYGRLPAGARSAIRRGAGKVPVAAFGRGLRSARWGKRFLDFADLPEEARFRRSYTLFDPPDLVSLLAPELAGSVDRVVAAHAATFDDTELTDPVNRMCLTDARMFMPGLNLAYTDRASMAASTEVRTPFVDRVVFDAAFGFDGTAKIRRGVGKRVLKEAARAWLPARIIDRPKASFSAPLRAWISRDLVGLVDDTLLRGRLVDAGIVSAAGLRRLVADDRAGRADNSKQIWQFLTLELWYDQARRDAVTTSTLHAEAALTA